MSTTGLDVSDTTLQQTNHWLKLMTGEFGPDDRFAFGALRAALRDTIGGTSRCLSGGDMTLLRGGLPREALNLWLDSMLRRDHA